MEPNTNCRSRHTKAASSLPRPHTTPLSYKTVCHLEIKWNVSEAEAALLEKKGLAVSGDKICDSTYSMPLDGQHLGLG